MNRETDDGSDDATNTAGPEHGVRQHIVVLLIDLVEEPGQPENNAWYSKEQPVGIELLGAGHAATYFHQVVGHEVAISQVPLIIIGGTSAHEHKDACGYPESDGEVA